MKINKKSKVISVELKNDCMEPVLMKGDILEGKLMPSNKRPPNGDVVIIFRKWDKSHRSPVIGKIWRIPKKKLFISCVNIYAGNITLFPEQIGACYKATSGVLRQFFNR